MRWRGFAIMVACGLLMILFMFTYTLLTGR
jgi:hypothetical protein